MKKENTGTGPLYVKAWKDKRSRVARWGLILLVGIAVFADFIANDKPLYCKIEGVHRFPALREMFSGVGLTSWSLEQESTDWRTQQYQRVLFAPIPYSPNDIDLRNGNFKSPLDKQHVSGLRFRHWLGTDHLGRDVLAGLIHGTRITMMVGVCSMLLAALLGIPIGALAGFLGDDRLRMRFPQLVVCLVCGMLFFYFIVVAINAEGIAVTHAVFLAVFSILVALIINLLLRRWQPGAKGISIPVDTLTLRMIEMIRSIPVFFLLFAILGMLRTPKLIYVMLLIALLYSPSIMRFVRAEALKLRKQTFIQSATVLGLSDLQIIWRHIIPNAIGPALITIVFGIGSAVLVESGLSFLGIGISSETVSWGKMLNLARGNFSAWWMALLPGIAIFLTIATFNRLGDVLESRISGR
ncbi:MAG TPA: ABC transporter permease [Saprospiraceae bacterium]|nr:ABC transporter permease [Saprospiraceae bacterium]